jgi:endonuclease/exonuclease/phosphatase family metal-dependent hydrolase
MQLKIMTYNILVGFHGDKRVFNPKRLKHAQRVVRAEKPDILVLVEAHFGKPNKEKILLNYKKLFPFPYYAYAQRRRNGSSGVCLLSKFPIVSHKRLRLEKTPGLRAVLRVNEKRLHVDAVHLHPWIADTRKITSMRPHLTSRKHPYLVTGDFNSLSDEDKYDKQKYIKAFRTFTLLKGDSEALRFLKRKFIPFLRASGLRDAMPKKRRTHTIPTDWLSKNKNSAMRIDYCFVSSDILVKDAYVVQTRDAEYGSDHRPICTIIDI